VDEIPSLFNSSIIRCFTILLSFEPTGCGLFSLNKWLKITNARSPENSWLGAVNGLEAGGCILKWFTKNKNAVKTKV